MTLDRYQAVRVRKGLAEAAGYLELGMTRHAIACLDRLGDLGPFSDAGESLRVRAVYRQKHPEAFPFFPMADEQIDSPHECRPRLGRGGSAETTGDRQDAVHCLARARGAHTSLPAPRQLPRR